MGCLHIIALVALAAWADTATVRGLVRNHAGFPWWIALAVLTFLGTAGGIWCGFYCEYHVSPVLRVFSFPVPAAFFHLEDGQSPAS